ncbi:MAG TPA: heavy metal translocating P-type ATPase [Chryseolinea sp.]|nr:heavy metal translocating P-type ATPase [Chryseolinea sp.]
METEREDHGVTQNATPKKATDASARAASGSDGRHSGLPADRHKEDCCDHSHADSQGDQHNPAHDHNDHDHTHVNNGDATGPFAWLSSPWFSATVSFLFLVAGLVTDHLISPAWFAGTARLIWYGLAYLPVGLPILVRGVRLAFRGDVFTEFLLMSLATIGAFYIGEYPEGVAVMVFYAVGELFQDVAVSRAKRSIKALLDVRPTTAVVARNGDFVTVDPMTVNIGEVIRVKPGERVPLDGTMLSEGSSFNTAALTGESRPSFIEKEGSVLAGLINEDRLVDIRVTKKFNDSSLARILSLVQNAQGRKAKTELLIRKFARVYTPIVVLLAVALTFLPYFLAAEYHFQEWLYRALIFLVISCPCALVVAIPLGYFGGIGAGSRNGILFKGSSYLDRMTNIGTVVMDKTGTLTQGVFKVQDVVSAGADRDWLRLAAAIESQSSHPAAKAVVAYVNRNDAPVEAVPAVTDITELRGHGLSGMVEGHRVLAGNTKLLKQFNIILDDVVTSIADTVVAVAVDGRYAGHLTIADEIKPDASEAVKQLHALGITTVMLSGDKQAVVDKVASALGIDEAHGDLLPEDKVVKVEDLKRGMEKALAFVGDGINDAPVLAISDVGIAMGGLGSDVAIETADVVIQTDQPSKIVTAIRIGKATNGIVWQNIGLAFGVKVLVMALGAWGVASLWEAVFADVGVALLAILNAVRIQRMKFE